MPVSQEIILFFDYLYEMEKVINIDKEIMGGTPVFNNTRVPVRSLFDWLESETLEEFLENFPSVTKKQAIAVLQRAGNMVNQNEIQK